MLGKRIPTRRDGRPDLIEGHPDHFNFKNMYWVYILESQVDGRFYIGYTANLTDRLSRHNSGYERYTKKYIPWEMIFYTSFDTRSEALKLEKKLKSFKNRTYLKRWILEN